MSCFVQKNKSVQANFSRIIPGTSANRIDNLWVILVVLLPLTYQRIPMWIPFENRWDDWLSIKFCENGSFRKLSLFLENTFQYLRGICVESPKIFQCLISIPAGHWVRQIDVDLPRRFFLSALLSLVISKTGRSERSARALREGAEVVREAIGNQFCVRIGYMFLKSKSRQDLDLGLCTTLGLAFGEPLCSGDFWKKKVFRHRKNRSLPLRCGSQNASPEVVHRPRS